MGCGSKSGAVEPQDYVAGRVCPMDYKLDQALWAADPAVACDTLLVVGGLYGNPFAGDAVQRMAAAEQGRVQVVFNGDMHWFDRTAPEFARVEELGACGTPLVGNVEAELRRADDIGVGCGCAYPDCVDDASVARSNAIHHMMRDEVRQHPELIERLQGRAAHMTVQVGDAKVGITHGDEKLLGGWECGLDDLALPARQTELDAFMASNGIDIFATTHTCAAAALVLEHGAVINNGAAGLPTFAGQRSGILTRIAPTPSDDALYRTQVKGLYVEAVPVRYDHDAYLAWFDELWPAGSPAEISYRGRIVNGPGAQPADALLSGFELC